MPVTFEKIGPRDDHKIFDRLIQMRDRYHQPLVAAEVKIELLLARAARDKNGDANGPPLKKHGHPTRTIVRIVSLKDRVAGLGDVIIMVDGDEWDEWTPAELDATLDNALTQIQLVMDEPKDGPATVRRDDADRPVLRLAKGDFMVSGFASVIRRHKENAAEAQALQAAHEKYVQNELAWG